MIDKHHETSVLLKVIRTTDNTPETIKLTLPLRTMAAVDQLVIYCADGTEHFFDALGRYDGWARTFVGSGVSLKDALLYAIDTEKHRAS